MVNVKCIIVYFFILDESALLDNLIIQNSSEDDEGTAESIARSSSPPNKLVGLVVAFCLTFRVVYNIPDRAIVLLLRFF